MYKNHPKTFYSGGVVIFCLFLEIRQLYNPQMWGNSCDVANTWSVCFSDFWGYRWEST